MVAGLYAAIGLMSALLEHKSKPNALARSADVALTEAVFSLLEGALPEYGKLGEVRQPTGATLPTSAPSSAYPSADNRWVIIGANSDLLFSRLMKLIERPDLGLDERFADNPGRVAFMDVLDTAIGQWTITMNAVTAAKILADADLPSTLIYTIEDCANDVQFIDRDMILAIDDPNFGKVLHPGVVPKMSGENPGGVAWPGPDVGAHTNSVLRELLKIGIDEIEALRVEGVL
jgi:formyl-CoA transferase